jgi:hypothetical protein
LVGRIELKGGNAQQDGHFAAGEAHEKFEEILADILRRLHIG